MIYKQKTHPTIIFLINPLMYYILSDFGDSCMYNRIEIIYFNLVMNVGILAVGILR